MQKAQVSGYVSEDSTNYLKYFDKYAIIYAQEGIELGSLHVHAQTYGGKYHFVCERSGPRIYYGDPSERAFTHIGIYAHEFGHTIGFYDEYNEPFVNTVYESGNGTDIYNFCLMSWGIFNGPDFKGECPATLSPFYRINKTWVTPDTITADTNNFIVQYDFANPKYYRINPIDATNDEHYIIETKNREGFDLYIPGDPADSVNQPGRLLIWHHNLDPSPFPGPETDRILIKAADETFNRETQITDFFPSEFNPGCQDLNDITVPAATLGKVILPYPFISNERPAHFALNGIQKMENGNTLINKVWLNHQYVVNQNTGNWQTVSVPVGLYDYSLTSVFPGCSLAYKYESTYVLVDTLENGTGYWVKFPEDSQTVMQEGSPIEYIEVPVNSGWNITGSIYLQS